MMSDMSSPLEREMARLHDGLAERAAQLAAVQRVTSDRWGVMVEYPEGEFVVKLRPDPVTSRCSVVVTATIRAQPPALDTWWTDWNRSCAKDAALDLSIRVIEHKRATFAALIAGQAVPARDDDEI